MPVTVNSSSADGKHYKIKLDKTGADAGSVALTTWQPGQDPDTTPGVAQMFGIQSIKATADGSKLVCTTHVGFFSPTITVAVHDATGGQPPSIGISAPFMNLGTFPIAPGDETKLKEFVVGCAFPAL